MTGKEAHVMTVKSFGAVPACRRSILKGAAVAVAFASVAGKTVAAHAFVGSMTIDDLVDASGAATERALALVGSVVAVRGYPSPTSLSSPTLLALTSGSSAPCQLCGSVHDSGPAIAVEAKAALPGNLSMLKIVEVSGSVAVTDSREVRLVDAAIQVI
jgi:hypothetical protein